jgi:hypothetical protein
LKPYRQSGFQNSGEKINHRFDEADRLEAGGSMRAQIFLRVRLPMLLALPKRMHL